MVGSCVPNHTTPHTHIHNNTAPPQPQPLSRCRELIKVRVRPLSSVSSSSLPLTHLPRCRQTLDLINSSLKKTHARRRTETHGESRRLTHSQRSNHFLAEGSPSRQTLSHSLSEERVQFQVSFVESIFTRFIWVSFERVSSWNFVRSHTAAQDERLQICDTAGH